MRSYTVSKGFSLIELMIVIAIIGILAAVSVPSYQNYVLKAKVGDMLSAAGAAQLAVAEYLQTTGETNCSFMPGVDYDTREFPVTSNRVEEVLVIANCFVTVEGVASEFGGTAPFLTAEINMGVNGITWDCTMDSDVNYAPSSCPAREEVSS